MNDRRRRKPRRPNAPDRPTTLDVLAAIAAADAHWQRIGEHLTVTATIGGRRAFVTQQADTLLDRGLAVLVNGPTAGSGTIIPTPAGRQRLEQQGDPAP